MAASYYKLEIKNRIGTRSRGSKVLRKNGVVPGVLYYAGEESVNIAINKSILFHAMQSGQRIFEVDQDGEKLFTMIKDVQYHPVTDDIMHIDLMRVRRSEKMTISVPLVLVGEPIGVKSGGILSQSLNQIEISCFPTDVPEQVNLDITDLELNSAKSIGDIKVNNDDIEIITDSSLNVASVTPPAIEEEVEVIDEDEGQISEESEDKLVQPEKTDGDEPSAESGSDAS